LEAVLDLAQAERVVITRRGKPSAVVVGIDGYDEEDLALASSPAFWRMIEERRMGRFISRAELKKRLNVKTRNGPRKRLAKPGK
jgi:PHD/YefM family antitoxin component YafN of YafNO toxin-antitoxin module